MVACHSYVGVSSIDLVEDSHSGTGCAAPMRGKSRTCRKGSLQIQVVYDHNRVGDPEKEKDS